MAPTIYDFNTAGRFKMNDSEVVFGSVLSVMTCKLLLGVFLSVMSCYRCILPTTNKVMLSEIKKYLYLFAILNI